jgi:hypothetical protein
VEGPALDFYYLLSLNLLVWTIKKGTNNSGNIYILLIRSAQLATDVESPSIQLAVFVDGESVFTATGHTDHPLVQIQSRRRTYTLDLF